MTPTISQAVGVNDQVDVRPVGPVVFSQAEIADAVRRLAADISRDYQDDPPVVVGVLPGGIFLLADLVRALSLPVEVDVIAISRFGPPEETGGVVHIQRDVEAEIEGRPVLLVEDIVDTGLTVHHLLGTLIPRQPASVRVAALLGRPNRRLIRVPLHYVGFEAPEDFLVGYGLGHEGRFRQLPYIARYPTDPPEAVD
ncbi:MAG: phosphoribosyltransferase family protein [Anaerolineales bacterium]